MFKVLDIAYIGENSCVSVTGNLLLLKNGLELVDEKGHRFVVKSIGLAHYKNVEDMSKRAELILKGETKDMGRVLNIL